MRLPLLTRQIFFCCCVSSFFPTKALSVDSHTGSGGTPPAYTVICSPEEKRFEITARFDLDGAHGPTENVIKPQTTHCSIEKTRIRATIKFDPPRSTELCKKWPHRYLVLTADDRIILGDVPFLTCSLFVSVHRVRFAIDKQWQVCLGEDYGQDEFCTDLPIPHAEALLDIWDYISDKSKPLGPID